MSDDWQPFFLSQIGASAALLGLIFVGVSLNLDRILAGRMLPRRALLALLLMLVVLVIGSLALVPGQPARLLAAELALAGALINFVGCAVSLGSWRTPATARANIAVNFLLTQAASLPYLAAAWLAFTGGAGVFGWIAAGMIVSTIKAVSDAWVLLVEINR